MKRNAIILTCLIMGAVIGNPALAVKEENCQAFTKTNSVEGKLHGLMLRHVNSRMVTGRGFRSMDLTRLAVLKRQTCVTERTICDHHANTC